MEEKEKTSAVIRIMTKEENLKKAMQLHVQRCSSIASSDEKPLPNMYNEALQLLIDGVDEVFAGETMVAAAYAGNEPNREMLKKAQQIYKEKTGLKASTRRLFDLAIKLYINKYQNK